MYGYERPECFAVYRKDNIVCKNCMYSERCEETEERPSCFSMAVSGILVRCKHCKYYYSCINERDAYHGFEER